MPLTAEKALLIVQTAVTEARHRKFAPICAVVLDAGGHALAVYRDDGASISRPEIATAKAAGCLGMGFGGRELAKRAQANAQFYTVLSTIFPQGIVPLPGGVLIRDNAGVIIGAVGASGDTGENDEICVLAGIHAAELKADTGA
jgi:uncharacterized protein GlcG (DUF336 family)